jgi:hypothetical protein
MFLSVKPTTTEISGTKFEEHEEQNNADKRKRYARRTSNIIQVPGGMEARQSSRPRPSLYLNDTIDGTLVRDKICAFGPAPVGRNPGANRCLP